MPHRSIILIASLALACIAGRAAHAHEFWIEPQEFQVETGGEVRAILRNGQEFEGMALAYFDRRIARFDWAIGDDGAAVAARSGDNPALAMAMEAPGLLRLAYQSTAAEVDYKTWEKFAAFAEHKDFGDIRARHDARGLPEADFTEVYTRFARSLIAVAEGSGADRPSGLETEIVALENPYTRGDDAGPLPVQVLYQGAPRPDAQVEIFERGPADEIAITTTRTTAEGIAHIPVRPGHDYLLDSVVLREPAPALAEKHDAVWETLWASITFSVPE